MGALLKKLILKDHSSKSFSTPLTAASRVDARAQSCRAPIGRPNEMQFAWECERHTRACGTEREAALTHGC